MVWANGLPSETRDSLLSPKNKEHLLLLATRCPQVTENLVEVSEDQFFGCVAVLQQIPLQQLSKCCSSRDAGDKGWSPSAPSTHSGFRLSEGETKTCKRAETILGSHLEALSSQTAQWPITQLSIVILSKPDIGNKALETEKRGVTDCQPPLTPQKKITLR